MEDRKLLNSLIESYHQVQKGKVHRNNKKMRKQYNKYLKMKIKKTLYFLILQVLINLLILNSKSKLEIKIQIQSKT